MYRHRRHLGMILIAASLCLYSVYLLAEDEDREKAHLAAVLPTDETLWLNSAPITWEQIRGKGACLFFFRCEQEVEILPKYLESANRHMLDPVIFIGVSMGSDRTKTERFLRNYKYSLPTLCDPVHLYVRACDAEMQTQGDDVIFGDLFSSVYVTTDGKMVMGWWDDPELTVAEALSGAAWTVDPKEIPELLRPAWHSIEFHKYPEALPLLKKSLNSNLETQLAAAKKLQGVIQTEIDRLGEEVRSADEKNQKWVAYSKSLQIKNDFKGFELPKDLETLQKKLERTSQVKAGIVAEKLLSNISRNPDFQNAGVSRKIRIQLEKMVADFPDTSLARRAQKVLDSLPK